MLVEVGHRVEPAEVLATRRVAGDGGVSLPVAARLRRSPADAADLLVARPGLRLEAGLAHRGGRTRTGGRRAATPASSSATTATTGTALIAPLGEAEPIIGHVRGEVAVGVTPRRSRSRVAGALVAGVGGSGGAVHGGR